MAVRFVIALLGTGLAMSSQIWQITKLPILTSAKPRAWMVVTTSYFTLQMKASFVLLTLGSIVAILFDGLVAGFALLGALLIAAAIALPAFLAWCLRKLQKSADTPLWDWFGLTQDSSYRFKSCIDGLVTCCIS